MGFLDALGFTVHADADAEEAAGSDEDQEYDDDDVTGSTPGARTRARVGARAGGADNINGVKKAAVQRLAKLLARLYGQALGMAVEWGAETDLATATWAQCS